jgi:hypothetical protein
MVGPLGLLMLTACAAHPPPPLEVAPTSSCSSASSPFTPPAPDAPPRRIPTGCELLEKRQEAALQALQEAHPGSFSRASNPDSPEPFLEASIFRRCQRTNGGVVGLVPMAIEAGGVMTLRAVLIEDGGKERGSRSVRVREPEEWLLFEGSQGPLVVVTSTNTGACRDARPCTKSEAHALRFVAEGGDLLAPIAERWLGTTAPFADADDDTPLPWWLVIRSTAERDGLFTLRFRWPSLRVGNRLHEGIGGSAHVDLDLRAVLETADTDCDEAEPIQTTRSLWQSAQCARLGGAEVRDILVALRRRCGAVLAKAAGAKDSSVFDDDLCVDDAGRDWLDDEDGRSKKPRPPVRLVPGVERGLSRMGPALKKQTAGAP